MVPRRRAQRAGALKGPLYDKVAGVVGSAYVDKNITTWEAMQKVLDSGEHRPTHLRGWKPAVKEKASDASFVTPLWPPAISPTRGEISPSGLL